MRTTNIYMTLAMGCLLVAGAATAQQSTSGGSMSTPPAQGTPQTPVPSSMQKRQATSDGDTSSDSMSSDSTKSMAGKPMKHHHTKKVQPGSDTMHGDTVKSNGTAGAPAEGGSTH